MKYICSITGKGIDRDAVWFCSSTNEKQGEKYNHVKDSNRAKLLSEYQAKAYSNYYSKLGYDVRCTEIKEV